MVDYITYAKFPPKLAKFSFDNDHYSEITVHQPTKMHDNYFKKCCTTQIITTKIMDIIFFLNLNFNYLNTY